MAQSHRCSLSKRTAEQRVQQEVTLPVEKVTSLGKDTVLGDPEAQCGTKHHHCRQQEMEVLPEDGVTQEAGSKVRQDHQYCVEEHLDPELDL